MTSSPDTPSSHTSSDTSSHTSSSGDSAEPALVLVATPIGNLEDLSPRARRELTTAALIACEDTRRTGKLLELTGIGKRPLLMVNDHNETERAERVVQHLHQGERVVVVTDAGMPGISDPGHGLVQAAIAAGHRIEVVPGPSAVIAALVGSGLAPGRFCFEGFLPRKGTARKQRLLALSTEERTSIVFESPHRVAATLADLQAMCAPDRQVVVARELTKMYEEYWRGTLAQGVEWANAQPLRGEVVLVLQGAPAAAPPGPEDIANQLRLQLQAGATKKDAAANVASTLGVPRNAVYKLALELDS